MCCEQNASLVCHKEVLTWIILLLKGLPQQESDTVVSFPWYAPQAHDTRSPAIMAVKDTLRR